MHGSRVLLGILMLASWCLVGGCGKEEPRAVPPSKKTQKASKPTGQAKSPSTATKPATRAGKAKRRVGPSRAGKTSKSATTKKAGAPRGGPMRLGESRQAGKGAQSGPKGKAGRKGAKRGWGPIKVPDQLFYCPDCQKSFTLTDRQTRDKLKAMGKTAEGAKRRAMTCSECGKATAVPAMKCEKCGQIITGPKTFPDAKPGQGFPGFVDECPKCGHSRFRERVLKGIRRHIAQGRFDPDRLGSMQRKAIEDAKARGEWTDPKP